VKAGSTSDSINKKVVSEADAKIPDCFDSTDWNMFWDSSDGIEEYTTSVTGFINKCVDDIIPTSTVSTYPNQKPGIIHPEIKARAAAFKDLAMPSDEPSNQAKSQYRTKIESYYTGSDACLMWQDLQTITDYKWKHT
jgi:hypothetical protein